MRAQCYSAPVQRRYYAGSGSLPHLVSLLLLLVVVFVPLFLAQGSHGFWPKTNTYAEQPTVKLTYEVIVVLEGERVDAGGKKEYIRLIPNSLPPKTQRLLQDDMRASQIRAFEVDTNRDGAPETLHVRVTTPLQAGEAIHQVRAFAFLNYTLQSHAMINMDAVAAYTFTSPLPFSSISVDGDLRLEMRTPSHITSKVQRPFASKPLLNTSRIFGPQDLDLDAVVSTFRARDWHTPFHVPLPMWTTDVAPGAATTRKRSFHMDMTIRIPPVDVLYRPTWSELLKTAWIQYFSLLVIVYALVQAISAILYKNKLLDTYSVLDDPLVLTRKHQ